MVDGRLTALHTSHIVGGGAGQKVGTRMNKFSALLGVSAFSVALLATPAQALRIDFNNVNNISTTSDAYKGFRAAADFWQAVISTDVTLYFNVGFSSTGFSSANVIGSTGSTAFIGVDVQDVYDQLALTGTSRLDGIAAANMSPLSAVAAY